MIYPTIAVIPTRFEVDMLLDLLTVLDKSGIDRVLVLDNGHSNSNKWRITEHIKSLSKGAFVHKTPDMSIYQMWNYGLQYARYWSPSNVAILNDDIIIEPHVMKTLAEFLRSEDDVAITYPDYTASHDTHEYTMRYTNSTYGHGGMAGFCFMMKSELPIPYIDETFRWWYGDDDLVKQTQLLGYKIGRVVGLPVAHMVGRSSRFINVSIDIKNDNAYFNAKYGENRTI